MKARLLTSEREIDPEKKQTMPKEGMKESELGEKSRESSKNNRQTISKDREPQPGTQKKDKRPKETSGKRGLQQQGTSKRDSTKQKDQQRGGILGRFQGRQGGQQKFEKRSGPRSCARRQKSPQKENPGYWGPLQMGTPREKNSALRNEDEVKRKKLNQRKYAPKPHF